MPEIFLRLNGLCKTFTPEGKVVKALDSFSAEIERGSFTSVVGKSGCGKTTLLKCIAGLEKSDSGRTEFCGTAAAPKTGFVFQDPRLLPWLTVEGNLMLALSKKSGAPRGGKGDRYAPLIASVLSLVALDGWGGAYPRQLSGGMAQRASLARALCGKPELLLLDEPLGALDSFTRIRLREELDGIRRRLGCTAVLVTHDLEEAVYLGDKLILMERGRPAAEFRVTLSRPRDYRDEAFQALCREIEEKQNAII